MSQAARVGLRLRSICLILIGTGLLLLEACVAAGKPQDKEIKLPPGFEISLFAESVPGARSLTLSSSGTVFVGTRGEGKVYALPDVDKNGRADTVIVIARDLNLPNGVAFRDGALYVAELTRIIRYDNIEARLNDPPEPVVIYDRYPDTRSHGWKFIAFGPDGKLYIPVGAPCNVCLSEDEIYASITRMNPDGSDFEIFARGVRNTVGFDWSPATGDLWFTDNGRDLMGDDVPPDELDKAPVPGLHFGFPYCHGGVTPDPEFGSIRSCDEFVSPELQLGSHVAPLGMRFYTGNMFPEEYRNQIFIAEHGSWNRTTPIGYRVMLVKLVNDRPVSQEPFAEGWLQGSKAWGRPVDLQVLEDGSMLVSDDRGGVIYRVTYRGD